jgi:hypothetical protein
VAERFFIDFGPVGSLRNGRQNSREEGAQRDASHRNKCSAIDSTGAPFSPQRGRSARALASRFRDGWEPRGPSPAQRVMSKSRPRGRRSLSGGGDRGVARGLWMSVVSQSARANGSQRGESRQDAEAHSRRARRAFRRTPQSARSAGATDRARSRLRLHGGRFRRERELKSCHSSPRREPIRGSGEAPYPRRQPVMAIGRVHRRLTAKGPRDNTPPTPCSPGPQARPTSKPTSRA